MEEATNNFVLWLKENDVTVSSKVTIADLSAENQGRGVVAVEDIKPEENLFEIPLSAILNIETCSLVKDVSNAKSILLELNQWEALILVLLYELEVKQNDSKWLKYFKVLPICDEQHYKFDQLIFWSNEELSELSPSLIVERVGKVQAAEMFSKLSKVIEKLGLDIKVSNEKYQKIASVIMSYSFDVEFANEDEEKEDDEDEGNQTQSEILNDGYFKSMVPLADTLNADTEFHNAHLVYTEKSLIMTSTKPIKKGEQVYNTYSDHPNSEILRMYGYVQHHGSKYDFAEIPLSLIEKYFQDHYKLSKEYVQKVLNTLRKVVTEENESNDFEDEVDLVLDSYDCFKSHEVQTEFLFVIQLVTVIAIISPSIQGDEDFHNVIKRIYKKCYQLVESNKLTKEFLQNYKNILNNRLSMYPNISEAPKDISRKAMAQAVLNSEITSLKSCLETCKTIKTETGPFNFIDDDKLIRNIMKKRFNSDDATNVSKKSKK
jgi:SET domain-containing protein 6